MTASLVERVEGAEGADRELDRELGITHGGFFLAEPRWPGAEPMFGYVDSDGSRVEPGNGAQDRLIPAYTASIDAALTLVPEGWSLGQWSVIGKPDSCRIWNGEHDFCVAASTPALALCAAALRAREASRG